LQNANTPKKIRGVSFFAVALVEIEGGDDQGYRTASDAGDQDKSGGDNRCDRDSVVPLLGNGWDGYLIHFSLLLLVA
jgi:hypothetical protein